MKQPKNSKSRPIIIQSVNQPLSPEERRKIGELAGQLIQINHEAHRKSASLIEKYRDVVGFKTTKIELREQLEYMGFESPFPELEDWWGFAEAARKDWILEEFGIRPKD